MHKMILATMASAAAFAVATPANAAVTVTTASGNLSTAIHASSTNTADNALVVYGSTVGNTAEDVTFTGNTFLHITDGGGFASISDFNSNDATPLLQITIDPTPGFSAYEFAIAFDSDAALLVQYSLAGNPNVFLNALTSASVTSNPLLQKKSANVNYIVKADAGETLGQIRLTSTTSGTDVKTPAAINFEKQNSITLTSTVGAVPEPATWAMMLLGFGAAGMSLRRRKQVAPQAA